jgi:hypothetical protein
VQKFVRCDSFLSYSITVYSKISGESKPPGQKLDINGHKSQKLPYMVKCHVQTFYQDLSVTCDKGQILAPYVTHDRQIVWNHTVFSQVLHHNQTCAYHHSKF